MEEEAEDKRHWHRQHYFRRYSCSEVRYSDRTKKSKYAGETDYNRVNLLRSQIELENNERREKKNPNNRQSNISDNTNTLISDKR